MASANYLDDLRRDKREFIDDLRQGRKECTPSRLNLANHIFAQPDCECDVCGKDDAELANA